MSAPIENTRLLGDAGPPASQPQRSHGRWIFRASLVLLLTSLAFFLYGHTSTLGSTDFSILSSSQPRLGSGHKKYMSTQFMSFTINTLGGLAKFGECSGSDVSEDGQCYLGDKLNITIDVDHRYEIVRAAASTILDSMKKASSSPIDLRTDTLKILMLPEFYWRGPYGAYNSSDLYGDGVLQRLLQHVDEELTKPEFEDWLFVLGTVIGTRGPQDPLPEHSWDQEPLQANERFYYNFAPVIKGGPNGARWFVIKHYISAVDFLDRNKLPDPTDEGLHEYTSVSDSTADYIIKNYGLEGIVADNQFHVDGINFGVEICLDHHMKSLYDNIPKTKHKGKLKSEMDVQLITSCGMSIHRGPNPIKPGGVVYLTDGSASSAACRRGVHSKHFDKHTTCRKPSGDAVKSIPIADGYSGFLSMSACWPAVPVDLLDGFYSRHQKQGCAHTLHKAGIEVINYENEILPSIEVYPSVALPWRKE